MNELWQFERVSTRNMSFASDAFAHLDQHIKAEYVFVSVGLFLFWKSAHGKYCRRTTTVSYITVVSITMPDRCAIGAQYSILATGAWQNFALSHLISKFQTLWANVRSKRLCCLRRCNLWLSLCTHLVIFGIRFFRPDCD